MKLLSLLAALVLSIAPVVAQTPAGTVITSQATGTYSDAEGNVYTMQSNTVSVTVGSRTYKLDLYPPRAGVDVSGDIGTTVFYPTSVKNEGDAPDAFTYSVTGTVPAGYTVKFIKDDNGDGVWQETETTEYTVTGWVAPATLGAYGFIAIGIPTDAVPGVRADIDVRAYCMNQTTYDYTTIRVTPTGVSPPPPPPPPVVLVPELTLSSEPSVTTIKPGEVFQVTYTITNTGTATASDAVCTIGIPDETYVENVSLESELTGDYLTVVLPSLEPQESTTFTLEFRIL